MIDGWIGEVMYCYDGGCMGVKSALLPCLSASDLWTLFCRTGRNRVMQTLGFQSLVFISVPFFGFLGNALLLIDLDRGEREGKGEGFFFVGTSIDSVIDMSDESCEN